MASLGVVSQGALGPKEYGTFYSSEFAKWGKVVRDAGIKPE